MKYKILLENNHYKKGDVVSFGYGQWLVIKRPRRTLKHLFKQLITWGKFKALYTYTLKPIK